MTNQECMDELYKMLAFVQSKRQGDALNFAIYLTERASARYTDFIFDVGYACPRCGTFNIYNQDGKHCEYCPECGQRLKWAIDELKKDMDVKDMDVLNHVR